MLKIIESKSQKECEKEFLKISPETILQSQESIKPRSEDIVEVKFMATKELMDKLYELKNLLSHENKSHTLQELIDILATMALKNLKVKRVSRELLKVNDFEADKPDFTSAAEVSRMKFRSDHIFLK